MPVHLCHSNMFTLLGRPTGRPSGSVTSVMEGRKWNQKTGSEERLGMAVGVISLPACSSSNANASCALAVDLYQAMLDRMRLL